MTPEAISAFKKEFPDILENELMAKHTNLRIGGPARLFLVAEEPSILLDAAALARKLKTPWYVFGGGSNLLVSDDGYDGLMIQIAFRNIKLRQQTVTAEAGAITSTVARQTAEAGLAGLEWAVGVPGTIGGAIYGNSGCYGSEIKDNLVTVDCLDKEGKPVVYPLAECRMGYRDSRFKHEPHVILRATFKLTPGEVDKLKQRMDDVMRMRKEKQPLEFGSAGCMFKNFVFKDESELDRLKQDVKEIPPEMLAKKSLSAGWLIQQSGLMGEKIGDAQISDKHGNFIINLGKATAQDILMLTSKAKMKVRDDYNIMLEDEVQLAGF
ncbi:MAG: UDP-N-acetylmuramate dehydrogenase [Patescibacteria group bacterium]|nr:UDP-N-acetylmuramate dehydrogenase [Patescibacteria group bacterium]